MGIGVEAVGGGDDSAIVSVAPGVGSGGALGGNGAVSGATTGIGGMTSGMTPVRGCAIRVGGGGGGMKGIEAVPGSGERVVAGAGSDGRASGTGAEDPCARTSGTGDDNFEING